MPTLKCSICSKEYKVVPARSGTSKFCSYACAGESRRRNQRGENHPGWKGGERSKTCAGCDVVMSWSGRPLKTWQKQKFCSKPCADKHGFRLEGEAHPNYKPDSRRKAHRGKHGAWARAVLSRDHATCQHCGANDTELHAHHIKPFAKFPDLRWEISNGVTLCFRCHWAVHTAADENPVNSGKPLTDNAEGNPEPSLRGNPLEGVTTRGRAYRRWYGQCEECGVFISKRWSDAKGKSHHFCSKRCAGKFNARHRTYRPMAVISSTSAGPERDDIV